ncbi:MbeD family mobilization/exclusion protein [Yersinia sp. 2544 StPb PI]|uniref:MbeD family mobilization/exclusion protein n=1 Tax=Yersinia TaxID=629 RepID=UPI00119FF9B3|nr:MbeD family mobilization/exclusion protein [Yersinia mollaretii]ELI8129948.1 MbeD family mobilization/exclusion protein [Yersinia enterocolitica]
MTELETQLLSALEQLQSESAQHYQDWESAFGELQQMYDTTRQENAQVRLEIRSLSSQVSSLSEQLQRLNTLYGQNRR